MFRRIALLLVGLAGAALPAAAQTQARAFEKEDYARYFAEGRLETYSPYYSSRGALEILKSDTLRLGGLYVIHQAARSLDVSPNYDVWSDYPFYKIVADGEDQLVWNQQLGVMLFDYSAEAFDADDSVAWESHNDWAEISEDDYEAGMLHDFYRRADLRAGRDPDEFKARYRKEVTGAWMLKCFYLVRQEYEVECLHTHQPTGRVERHMYRRNSLTS